MNIGISTLKQWIGLIKLFIYYFKSLSFDCSPWLLIPKVEYKEKQTKASLEDDILNAWRLNTEGANQLISDLKGAFKYRHWLAHGRYWKPQMGRPSYDYEAIYELAEVVFDNFPFEGLNAYRNRE